MIRSGEMTNVRFAEYPPESIPFDRKMDDREYGAPVHCKMSVSWKGPLHGILPDQRDAMPELLPPRYGDAAASGIQVRVTPGDNRLETIDLAP